MKMLISRHITVSLVLLSCLLSSLQAQDQITGILKNNSGEPLSYANVLLLHPGDSTLVLGNVSDEKGKYILNNIPTGEYFIKVSMISYLDFFSEKIILKEGEETFQMSDIVMKENTTQLEEVQIIEKKVLFEQKIDRMVVNVANSITSAGTTALEVLKRSPGVLVNPQTNSINMSGKDGVVVMMNGKISRMPMDAVVLMLDGMSSDNIEKIELIHTPPSNFDAAGNAGFINIVLKKNQNEGLNGGFSVSAGYGRKEKAGASINLNYRKNKVNIFGDYSWKYNKIYQFFSNFRSFEFDGTKTENSGGSDRDAYTHVHNARLGIDYQVSDKTIVGGLVSWMDRYWKMDALNDVRIFENDQLISRINIPNDEINHSFNFLTNINVQHQISEDQKLNVDLDYAYFDNDNPSNYTNEFYDGTENFLDANQLRVAKKTPMNIWVGKIDYTRKFGEKVIWELGAKATSTTFDNEVLVEELIQDEWEVAPKFSSLAMMTEKIAATYSALTWKVNAKTDLKIGLRYEYTDANLGTVEEPNIVDRQYSNLFPSLFMANRINEENQVQFSYSRRINRPSFSQLAPFFIFFDPNTVGTGNPSLQPSISDAVRATYIWKTFQLGLQYSYTDGFIGRFQPEVDPETNTQVNAAKNFLNQQTASATISFPIPITDWWEIRTSWTGQWSEINDDLDGQMLSFSRKSWYMNGSSNFKLPNKFSVEVSGRYSSAQYFGTVLWEAFSSVDIGIQKEFENNNGILRFGVSDLFIGSNWTGSLQDPKIDFRYEGYYGIGERLFRLTYSKRFGNNKLKGARKRATGSAEEQRRAN